MLEAGDGDGTSIVNVVRKIGLERKIACTIEYKNFLKPSLYVIYDNRF